MKEEDLVKTIAFAVLALWQIISASVMSDIGDTMKAGEWKGYRSAGSTYYSWVYPDAYKNSIFTYRQRPDIGGG